MRILIADDDPQMLRALRITLSARGYEVETAADGIAAIEVAERVKPDVVVVDLGMPGLTGIQVIESLRSWTQVPILVVSGRVESWDKVEALDAGADDYVTKPFSADELLARVRALSRRAVVADDPVVSFGDVTVDLGARVVTRAGVPVRLTPTEWRMLDVLIRSHDRLVTRAGTTVRLTPTEWRLLEVLLRHPGRLVTRETLLTEVWGPQYTTDTGYLRLYLSQLRKKLEPDPASPRYLLTEPGMGYRFTTL